MLPRLEHTSSSSRSDTTPLTRLDAIVAIAAAAVVFAVYVRTMYPGIFGVGDATKFAFVGRILGTPHAPGYPLYVMVSHAFSYVPWGSLAHRMNGMSAFFGAVAVGLAYAGARVLGLGPLGAFAAAVSLGFGRSFWSKAIYAKTYTLNAAIVALGLLLLFRWGRTRRPSQLYLAIAVFALSLGNHLIVISLVPALIVYAILVDARQALSWRTIAFAVGAVALSLCQYLLILVRTLQHAPYLEARATTLGELFNVITVRRWSQEIGAYSGDALMKVRVPIVFGLVSRELTIAGLVLAVVGVVVLFRSRWREAALCALAALGVLLLTANMSSNEDEGFLLPAFLLLWLFAGAGVDWIVRSILVWRRRGGPFSPAAAAAALVCASAVPLLLVVNNYSANDHHDRTYEIRYFDALFDVLPARAAIVDDRYTIDMMLKYKLLGEDAARGRTIKIILPDHAAVDAKLAEGFQIFAFNDGRQALQSFGYEFVPVPLKERSFSTYLDALPAGWTVAFASTPAVAPFLRQDRRAWQRIGADGNALFGGRQSVAAAIVGIAGKAGAAQDARPDSAAVSLPRGGTIGGSGVAAPASIQVSADAIAARVVIDGRELARSDGGAVLAVFDRGGHARAYALDPRDGVRAPLDTTPMPLYRMSGASSCRDIGNAGWLDLSTLTGDGRIAIHIDNYRPFMSRTILYLAGAEAAHPQLSDLAGNGAPAVSGQAFATGSPDQRAALERAAAADGAVLPSTFASAPVVSRVEFDVNDGGADASARIAFGMVPTGIVGRSTVDLNNPKRATVCGHRELVALGVTSPRRTAP